MRYDPHASPRLLDVGDHRVASYTVGSGPHLLFVHGWPLHAATFRHVIDRLSDSFTCHAIDLPGAGRTESKPGAAISFVGHAEVVRGAASALGLDRYGLVAHDSGGFVARHVAANDARVGALVLGNTEIPGLRAWQMYVYLATARLPLGGRLLAGLLSSRVARRSALAFGTCFADLDYLDGEFHDLFVEPLIRSRSAAEGQTRALSTMSLAGFDGLEDIHPRIQAPVRLVWGARDTFFPIEGARRMAPQFGGGADLREIEDGKLFAHEDRPDAFAAHAREFLERHLGRHQVDSGSAQERV